MTLVAFALRPDGADVVTDSLSYGTDMYDHEMVDKLAAFPQWDTVVTGVGPVDLTAGWRERLRLVAPLVAGFDVLDQLAPEVLAALWADIPNREAGRATGTIVHVGWSARRGRFAASLFDASYGFTCTDLTDHRLLVLPHPHSYVPRRVPESDHDWRKLAEASHEDWTLAGPRSLLDLTYRIGGDVVRTSVSRGELQRRVVHTFPTHGRQWRWSLIGSTAVEGQLGPCSCGSGLPSCMCHLPSCYDRPCPCPSGKTLGECHAIMPDDPRVLPYYRAHVADFERTRDELAARYRRRNPDQQWPPAQMLRPRGWAALSDLGRTVSP